MTSRGIGHGGMHYFAARYEAAGEEFQYPQVQLFSEGNGGEMRLSYHGYPKGYAQLIESPDSFQVTPMQIDTWNRDLMKDAHFVPGAPLPRNTHPPASSGYSGLIECPCSDKFEKVWGKDSSHMRCEESSFSDRSPSNSHPFLFSFNTGMSYSLAGDDCIGPIANATECFAAARIVIEGTDYVEESTVNEKYPQGCTASVQSNGVVHSIWNTISIPPHAERNVHKSPFDEHQSLIAFATGLVNTTVLLSRSSQQVKITITGPSDRWFGIAFGSDTMCIHQQADECPTGGPYAIIVQGVEVHERKLGYHGKGIVLQNSLTILENEIQGGNRSVVLTRPLEGSTAKHYTFTASVLESIPMIMARGCNETFARHCGHGPSVLNFLPPNSPTSICQAGVKGTIGGNKFRNRGRCAPFPTSELLNQKNPTCQIQTYVGGMGCCRDGQTLLDRDQKQPWPEQPLEYRLKFRFYFQEHVESSHSTESTSLSVSNSSHTNLVRFLWMTESFANEYDIPKCAHGTPANHCVHTITSQWKVREMLRDCPTSTDAGSWCTGIDSTNSTLTKGIELIYAGPHCHAPSCLSMELYNADTGRLLCSMNPVRGTNSSESFNEDGFVALPPCLWGEEGGLPPPELLGLDTTLLSIKRNSNIMAHTGE